MIKDPWTVSTTCNQVTNLSSDNIASFEDNFSEPEILILPDSKEYLKALENKLQKLKTKVNTLTELSARREQCLENLLRGNITLPTDADFGLDGQSDPEISESLLPIVRHIIPEQAISPGELVHIIKYDQLEQYIDTAGIIISDNQNEDH